MSFAFEVSDQGEWISLGQSTLDLSQQKSSHVTLEIADNEDPICELSLQMHQVKSLVSSVKHKNLAYKEIFKTY